MTTARSCIPRVPMPSEAGIKPVWPRATVVGDRDTEAAREVLEPNLHRGCAAVADGVAKRLLDDAMQVAAGLGCEPHWPPGRDLEARIESRSLADVGDQRGEARYEVLGLHDVSPELAHHEPEPLEDASELSLQRLCAIGRETGRLVLGEVELDHGGRERLDDHVVKLASDPLLQWKQVAGGHLIPRSEPGRTRADVVLSCTR